jgi:hypothetical protein
VIDVSEDIISFLLGLLVLSGLRRKTYPLYMRPPSPEEISFPPSPEVTPKELEKIPEEITEITPEIVEKYVKPEVEYKAPSETFEKIGYEPECVSPEGHKLVGSGRYKPSADELIRFLGFSSVEADVVVKYGLCYVKYCKFSTDGQIYTKHYLVCKPYSIIDMSHNVWLWIHTDLDCRNVLCMAFLDDAYAYPLTYYPDKDAYRYFIQIPIKVLQYNSNQITISGFERCGEIKVTQQSYPYQTRSKRVCVNVNQNEIDITL